MVGSTGYIFILIPSILKFILKEDFEWREQFLIEQCEEFKENEFLVKIWRH